MLLSKNPEKEKKLTPNGIQTLKTLIPYLWPRDSLEMRFRVVISLLFLALAKGISAGAPILYKMAVDEIADTQATINVVPVPILIAICYENRYGNNNYFCFNIRYFFHSHLLKDRCSRTLFHISCNA